MTPDILPGALHGFLKACGLRVSCGDDGGINLASGDDGVDADALAAFLDAPLRSHVVANKPGILACSDAADTGSDDAAPGDDDDTLCRLAAESPLVSWRDAIRATLGRVALRKWERHCAQSQRAGLRAQSRQEFCEAETRRLLRVCNL